MSDETPHDWYLPRLQALVGEAQQAGFAPDVSVAVITDLMNGPAFQTTVAALPDEDWNRDIGEPEELVNQTMHAGGDVRSEHTIGGRVGPGKVKTGIPNSKPVHHFGPHGLRRL